jgi:hypothetical protein
MEVSSWKKIDGRLTSPVPASRPVYRLPAAPRKWSGDTMPDQVRRQPKMNFVIEAGILIYKRGVSDLRIFMITRRTLILTGMTGLFTNALSRPALAEPPAANDPVAIVNAIYARAAKGKGDGGGGFVIENKAAKAKYLSKALVTLWAKADAHTPKGDVGPVDFDPVTNSQEPDIKSFKAVAEKLDADWAVIAVTIAGRGAPRAKPADNTIRYNFVHDDGQWKIDDISGVSDGEPWSIRGMLTDSLKN